MLRKGKNKHLCNFSCFLSKQLFCDCTHRNSNSMLLTIAFAVEIDCGVTVVRMEKESLVQGRWVCPAGMGRSLPKGWQMLVGVTGGEIPW